MAHGSRSPADDLRPRRHHPAFGHIAVTNQKLSEAWHGRWHPNDNGAAYQSLSDAMRGDLL